jgi:hypothetical protein
MDVSEDNRARKPRRARNGNEAPVSAPADVATVLRIGGTAALACAAASSAVSLFWLAILVGWPIALAWLLPASLDVYAGTSLYVGYRLPVTHPAAKSARRNARFALGLTVACNGIYHALVLFSSAWPYWIHDSLLVLVSALPPIVVERLLHLRSKIGHEAQAASGSGSAAPAVTPLPVRAPGNGKTPAAATGTRGGNENPAAAPALPPTRPGIEGAPAAVEPGNTRGPDGGNEDGGNVVAINGNGRLSLEAWATIALPLFREHAREHGEPPTANTLVTLIRAAHPDLRVPASERSARNIRSATETLAAGPADAEEAEPDREWAAS